MTLACGLIWVGYQKRMSCTTVLTSLTSSPIVTTSAIHSYQLNTHNLLYRESRRQSKESQHSFDAQRGRYQARDEEHARLRDEEHARPSGSKRFLCAAD